MNQSRQVSDLLAAAREVWQPDDAARARVRSGVMVRVGLAAAAGTSVAASASSAGAAAGAQLGSGLVAKLLVSIAIVGGVGTAGYVAATRPGPRPRPVPAIAAPRPEARPARKTAAVERQLVAAPQPIDTASPRRRDSRVRQAEPARPASTLGDELALLRAAMQALEAGDPATALTKAAEYDREFAGGELGPEIAAVRIDALCALGRHQQAARGARRFLETWAESPLAERVRASCAAGGAE